MVYEANADPRGPYWAQEWHPRDHCYSVVPLKDGNPRNVTQEVWREIFFMLGGLGYLFREAGHDIKHAVVSLNRAITSKHLKALEGKLTITPDSGSELAFI